MSGGSEYMEGGMYARHQAECSRVYETVVPSLGPDSDKVRMGHHACKLDSPTLCARVLDLFAPLVTSVVLREKCGKLCLCGHKCCATHFPRVPPGFVCPLTSIRGRPCQ